MNWSKYNSKIEEKFEQSNTSNTWAEAKNTKELDNIALEMSNILVKTVDELCPLIHPNTRSCNKWFNEELKKMRADLGKAKGKANY